MQIRMLTLCALCLLPYCVQAQDGLMSCDDVGKHKKGGKADTGATVQQIKPHLLQVNTAAGPRRFADKAPYGEELSGVRYEVCSEQDGFVLLHKADEGLFTGTLIDLQSGAVTPGGETVLFSPDRRAYFVTEQPDGLDGSQWKIYARDGRLSWSGYSFTETAKGSGMVAMFLGEPHWLPNGEFAAKASCNGTFDDSWPVKLIRQAKGEWRWQPQKKCPAR